MDGLIRSGAVALDGDCSLGPRSTENGILANVSGVELGLDLELRTEAGC